MVEAPAKNYYWTQRRQAQKRNPLVSLAHINNGTRNFFKVGKISARKMKKTYSTSSGVHIAIRILKTFSSNCTRSKLYDDVLHGEWVTIYVHFIWMCNVTVIVVTLCYVHCLQSSEGYRDDDEKTPRKLLVFDELYCWMCWICCG